MHLDDHLRGVTQRLGSKHGALLRRRVLVSLASVIGARVQASHVDRAETLILPVAVLDEVTKLIDRIVAEAMSRFIECLILVGAAYRAGGTSVVDVAAGSGRADAPL